MLEGVVAGDEQAIEGIALAGWNGDERVVKSFEEECFTRGMELL